MLIRANTQDIFNAIAKKRLSNEGGRRSQTEDKDENGDDNDDDGGNEGVHC